MVIAKKNKTWIVPWVVWQKELKLNNYEKQLGLPHVQIDTKKSKVT
jgi:hypothetical protein